MDGSSVREVSFSFSPRKKTRRCSFHGTEWRDWSGLPDHLLFDIAGKFTEVEDCIRFGRVCISWQRIFLEKVKNLGSPVLLIESPDDEDYHNQRVLYCPSTESVCDLRIQLPHSKMCRGCSFGWLITMEIKGPETYLVELQNPLLDRTINLPPLDNIVQLHLPHRNPNEDPASIYPEYLLKAALSSDPFLSDDFMVMGIMSQFQRLAYLKPGNRSSWTSIGEKCKNHYTDVIFFHKARKFYVLRMSGVVVAVEFQGDAEDPKLTHVAPRICKPGLRGDRVFLVEDLPTGDLLQVHRLEDRTEKDENGKRCILIRFRVFKFNPKKRNWTEMRNLGDKVVFTGSASSMLRSASDCPGCRPNCIYYTTDPHDARVSPKKFHKPLYDGVYSMEDGTTQLHYMSTRTDRLLPNKVWFEPNLGNHPDKHGAPGWGLSACPSSCR